MRDNCEICQLDLFLVDRIKRRYLEGEDPEELAILFGQDAEATRAHCQSCIKRPRSTQARYKDLVDQLEEDIEGLRRSMVGKKAEGSDIEEGPIPALVQGYARLVSEYKEAMVKVEEMTKPEDKVKETVIQVINPFLREMLKGLTEEVNRLKAELRLEGLEAEVSNKLLEEFFRRSADKLKLSSSSAVENLNTYFGATSSKRDSEDNEKIIQ